jgi:hypothetical protein
VGLFIDEVGKFITATNDYFHPAAAPIIYATFLLTVFVYLQVRKPRSLDERAELYWALEDLREVLDHHLEQYEYEDIENRLRRVSRQSENPIYQSFSKHLMAFMNSEVVEIVSVEPSWWARQYASVRGWGRRWLTGNRLKAVLIGGMLAVGVWELRDLIQLLLATRDPDQFRRMVAMWTELGDIASITALFWFAGRVAIEGIVGFLLILASILLLLKRNLTGTSLAVLTLMFALTAANLVAFYVDQFSTIIAALIQFMLLLTALLLQSRLEEDSPDRVVT